MIDPYASPQEIAGDLLEILERDLQGSHGRPGLIRVDQYRHGIQADPYMPKNASDEYKLLASRATTNVYSIVVPTPIRSLYVEGYRRGDNDSSDKDRGPRREIRAGDKEWRDWQDSMLDERQSSIMESAYAYGHSFTLTLPREGGGGSRTIGLSPLKTSALFEDPANDVTPAWALTEVRQPSAGKRKGRARMWDDTYEYVVEYTSRTDSDTVRIIDSFPHNATAQPVTRFAPHRDLEGRTIGVVERFMPMQDRLNQSIFDLLVVQAGGSFSVRWASGMAPPLETVRKPVLADDGSHIIDPETGDPLFEDEVVLDANGKPKTLPVRVGAGDLMYAEDPETKFGTLDATPLDGYIASIAMTFQHISALSQTPPHHLLGQIANLSAEALLAAESAHTRLVEQLRHSFGESWERILRLSAAIRGDMQAASDTSSEVLWRDMEQKALAAQADGLLKLSEMGVPLSILLPRIPGITQSEISQVKDTLAEAPATQVSASLDKVRSMLGKPDPTQEPDATLPIA